MSSLNTRQQFKLQRWEDEMLPLMEHILDAIRTITHDHHYDPRHQIFDQLGLRELLDLCYVTSSDRPDLSPCG
jgi:hypothetical protein